MARGRDRERGPQGWARSGDTAAGRGGRGRGGAGPAVGAEPRPHLAHLLKGPVGQVGRKLVPRVLSMSATGLPAPPMGRIGNGPNRGGKRILISETQPNLEPSSLQPDYTTIGFEMPPLHPETPSSPFPAASKGKKGCFSFFCIAEGNFIGYVVL